MHEDDIRACAKAFVDAWNSGDFQSLTELLASDMEFVNALGLWWRGRQEVIRGLEAMRVFGAKITLDAITVRVPVRDAAIASASFAVSSFTGPDGRQRPEQKGVMTMLLINQEQRWLIAAGQITAVNEAVIEQLRARKSGGV